MNKESDLEAQRSAAGTSGSADLPSLNKSLGVLQAELERLRSAAEHIELSKEVARGAVAAAHQTLEAARHVERDATGLVRQVGTLVDRLDKVDFPSRLDKLDATMSAAYTGLQLIQGRLDGLERNLKDHVHAYQITTREHLDTISRQAESRMKTLGQLQLLLAGGTLLVVALLLFR